MPLSKGLSDARVNGDRAAMLNAWSRDPQGKPLPPPRPGPRVPPTVSRVALVVAESSRCSFFPASTAFRCFRTSLLSTQWNRRTKRPWREGTAGQGGDGLAAKQLGSCGCQAGGHIRLPKEADSTATPCAAECPEPAWLRGARPGRPLPGASACPGERGRGSQHAKGQGGAGPSHTPVHLHLQHDITCWEALSANCKWPTPSPQTKVGCTLPRGGRMSPGTGRARDSAPGVPGKALDRAALWTPGSLASREPPAHSGHTGTTMPWPLCPGRRSRISPRPFRQEVA